MSTNIDHFSPDENWLQGLANDLFKKDLSYATGAPVQSQILPLTDNPTDPRFVNDFVSHPSSLTGIAVASPGI